MKLEATLFFVLTYIYIEIRGNQNSLQICSFPIVCTVKCYLTWTRLIWISHYSETPSGTRRHCSLLRGMCVNMFHSFYQLGDRTCTLDHQRQCQKIRIWNQGQAWQVHREAHFLLLIGSHCTPLKTILHVTEPDNKKSCFPAVTVGNYEALHQQSAFHNERSDGRTNNILQSRERLLLCDILKKWECSRAKFWDDYLVVRRSNRIMMKIT
jgi:hypothetical protein